jgi:hypothetical protein
VSRRTAGASTQDPESGLGHALSYGHAAMAFMPGHVCSIHCAGAPILRGQYARSRYLRSYICSDVHTYMNICIYVGAICSQPISTEI